jgi:UDP:flavonoid glycosyltransferase YjiC (YdhE family)
VRILATSFPAYGHFHPLAPLALAAQDAGHEVRLATGPDCVAGVERRGLAAFPIGMAQEDAVRAAEHRYAAEHAAAHLFTSMWVPAAQADLRRLASAWRPDLVLHEEDEPAPSHG